MSNSGRGASDATIFTMGNHSATATCNGDGWDESLPCFWCISAYFVLTLTSINVFCLQIPRDLHTINELGVLISTLETVAGLLPLPPKFPTPKAFFKAPPRTRAHGEDLTEDKIRTEEAQGAADDAAIGDDSRVSAVADDLGNLKVADLKDVCKGLGLKVGGKKDELIERIRAHRAAELGAAAPAPMGEGGANHSSADDAASESIVAIAATDLVQDRERSEDEWRWSAAAEGEGMSSANVVRYMSTRGHAKARWRGRLSEAVREGQPQDGGLHVPSELPDLRALLPSWVDLSFPELAVELAKIWMGKEWSDETMPEMFGDMPFASFADRRNPVPVREVAGHPDTHVLELFHGPTGAPQDSVTQPLAQLLSSLAVKRRGRSTVIAGWASPLESLSVAAACSACPNVNAFFCAPLDIQPTTMLERVCQMQLEERSGTHVVFVPSDEAAIAELIAQVLPSLPSFLPPLNRQLSTVNRQLSTLPTPYILNPSSSARCASTTRCVGSIPSPLSTAPTSRTCSSL
jgi:hypothetical protein